jgi:hypothetical protein
MHRRFTDQEEGADLAHAPGWGAGQTHCPDHGRQNVSLRKLISGSGGIRPRARVINDRHLTLAERSDGTASSPGRRPPGSSPDDGSERC